jgi:WD40 repeat protein
MKKRFVISLLLSLAPLVTSGAEISTEPILRIETGMHTATIRRIATDAAGKFLVTGSEDKTIRVWDLSNGELLRTLRPPIGPGDEGKIYAVAITPGGETIAATGWLDFRGGNSIYLFDRATGRLLRSLKGLPSDGNHLAFSRDGQRLAVSLSGTHGIRVFRVADGEVIAQDDVYSSSSYGLAWDGSGRLVASSEDGYVRLYNKDFNLIAKKKVARNEEPFGVSFSPDGQKIACGYSQNPRVDILDGTDLHLLYQADTTGIDNGDLATTEWSADGQMLFAGGTYWDTGQYPIRRWEKAGRGSFRDFFVGATNTIQDLKAIPGGRLVFGASSPNWGVLTTDGKRELIIDSKATDFKDQTDDLRISPSGDRVRFDFQTTVRSAAVFSVTDRTLTLDPAEDPLLAAPRTKIAKLKITDWSNTTHPAIDDKKLQVDHNELSYSLAVATDEKSFVLGTAYHVRSFDRTGKERWSVPIPECAWAVNLSTDGRLVVVAFADGTIRWFRSDNGQEILAFFPHADRKRWVAWTPSGYYDASIGGEELIGWHVNREQNQTADFFPAARFRGRFYRPDVISRVLTTRDEAMALAQADAEAQHKTETTTLAKLLPPVVTILAPAAEAEVREVSVPFRVTVRSPSGEPVTAVRAYVDGRPAGAARGLVYEPDPKPADPSSEREYTFIVPIPSRDCTVAITAETRLSSSDPVPAKLHWAAAPSSPEKPKLYLLAVGVGTYANPGFNLDLPAKDARDIAASWKAQKGGLYRDVDVKLLTDAYATKDAILDDLEWLERQTTEKDVAVLYFSGHGLNDPRTGEYLFLPYEADLNSRRKTLLPDREVRSALSTIPGKVLVFLDTCHSGNLLGTAKSRDASDLTRLLNELTSAENGVVVFSASTGRQQAIESSEWKNGAFTSALLEALSGKANYRDNSLYITELESYLDRRVKEMTRGLQTPVAAKPSGMPDFPVALAVVPK